MGWLRVDPAGHAGKHARLPLSPLQEAMLYAHRVIRNPDLHLEQWVMVLPELLNVARFRLAWQLVWARHPALRSGFGMDGNGIPFQWTTDVDSGVPFRQVNLAGAADSVEMRWEELLAEDRACGFDLSRPPCTRLLLAYCGDREWRACWSLHHILLDGRSMSTVLREVFSFYDGMGMSSEVDDVFHRYLRGIGAHGPTTAVRDFWCQSLEGVKPLGGFPFERRAASTECTATDSLTRTIPAELCDRLHAAAAALDTTINSLVQAAWGWALGLFSGSTDVVFAALRAGRPQDVVGARSAVGQFVSTLPVRVALWDENLTLGAWLVNQRSVHVAAAEHAWVTPGEIAAWLGQGSEEPLFSSLLVFERERPERGLERTCGGEKGRRFSLRERADFPLILSVWEREMEVCLAYDSQRYPGWAMDELLDTVQHLLDEMTGDSTRQLRDIPLLPPARYLERQDWNGKVRNPPERPFLHAGFEAIADSDPARPCLVDGQLSWTYGDLEISANKLAHRLIELGVKPEVRVALWLDKSFLLPAAILGILKAGGAYVPLDFGSPGPSLARMLSVSGADLLIVDDVPPACMQATPLIRVLSLASEAADLRRLPSERPKVDLRAHHLAYAIYTSGTSGIPKLVGIEHRSAANLIAHAVEDLLDSAEVARVPFVDNVAFDSSVAQMFVTWSHGGALLFQADIATVVRGNQGPEPTAIGTVPSALRALLETAELPLSIRVIGLGGESIPAPLLDKIGRLRHVRKIYNYYGPTESTVYSMVASIECLTIASGEVISHSGRNLGLPIRNTQVHLLDACGRPVPLGAPGEIHIGGLGVSRGYLGAPELTAQCFRSNPWGDCAESLLYRTGDLGFRLPDGTVEFLGRCDQQVKVRGLRVEMEAVEAELSAHPSICNVVVLSREDIAEDPRLVAYYVRNLSAASISVAQLRDFLTERLPAYMVPSAFLELHSLPLTSNGKLDRRALPTPSFASNLPQRVPPATDLERQLYAIWTEVLGHSDFGSTDNFFAIGGHSLLTMRVDQLVRERLGLEVPIYLFFSHPTVQRLCSKLSADPSALPEDHACAGSSERSIEALALPPPIRRFLSQQQIFLQRWPGQLSPGHQFVHLLGDPCSQCRLFWCFQGSHEHEALAGCLSPEVSLYGMRSLHGCDDSATIYGQPPLLAIVAGLYSREVLDHVPLGEPLVVGGNCQSAWIANAIARQLVGCGRQVQRLIMMELCMQEIEQGMLNWDGPVVLIWGDESRFNPFSSFYRPESRILRITKRLAPAIYRSVIRSRLKKAFKGGFQVSIVSGAHGAFFQSVNVEGLARVVKGHVVEASVLGFSR